MIALCARAGVWPGGSPSNTLEVGCGDGALLCELRRRGFGGALSGVEITQAAVEIARSRAEIASVELYDGARLPAGDGVYELGIVSHVLEHVPDPAALLAEVARACQAVLVEVPLEANWSARRAGKRAHAAEVGHVQRLDRAAIRDIVARAGLSIAAELEDPLPLAAQRFFARTPRARASATLKWAVRAACTDCAHRSRGGCSRSTTRACAWRRARSGGEQQRQHRAHQLVRDRVGVGELLARDAVGERVDRDRQLLGGQRQLEVELAHAVGDQLRQHLAHLREALGHLRAHLRRRGRRRPRTP